MPLTDGDTMLTYDGKDHAGLLEKLEVTALQGGQSTSLKEGDYSYSVTYNGKEIESQGGYTGKMTNAGMYVVTVKGADSGSYDGKTGTLTIYIAPRDIADSSVDFVPDESFKGDFSAEYNGQAHDHPFTLQYDGKTLTAMAGSGGSSYDYQLVDPDHDSHTAVGEYTPWPPEQGATVKQMSL